MIESLTIDNIRLFSGPNCRFDFAPLTVICGTNSSGKSTLLKTLLLLRQSQGIKQGLGTGSGKLQFVGSQVDLGGYESLVTGNDTSKNIRIEMSIRDVMPQAFFLNLQELLKDGKSSHRHAPIDDAELPYILNARFEFSFDTLEPSKSIGIEKLEEDEEGPRVDQASGVLSHARFAMVVDGAEVLAWTVKLASERPKDPHFRYELTLPKRYFKRMGGPKLVEVGRAEDSSCISVNTMLRGLLPDRIFAKLRPDKLPKKGGEEIGEAWVSGPLPMHVEMALRDFHRSLSNIHYLGPLRSPAQRFYVSYAPDSAELDSSGAFLPAVLRSRGDAFVLNWRNGQDSRERLIVALHYWLSFLRTGEFSEADDQRELEVRATRDVLIEIMIRGLSGEQSFALADSGFGYSQVIPILVRGLLARQHDTLVVEQPELHLNPALQVRLAKFFTDMSKAGKQILIETHSEHIVNSIRALAAEDDSKKTAQLCKILYMSSATAGSPVIKDLSVQPDGTVPDWPPEFFGEAASLAGRILRAQRRKQH